MKMQSLRNVYIHLPFCLKKCRYCAFPVHAVGVDTSHSELQTLYTKYLDFLAKEIQASRRVWQEPLETLYLGGGTPSLLAPNLLRPLLGMFPISSSSEVTLEMMASDVQSDLFSRYQEIGVNRFSIGVQSLNRRLMESVNRPSFDLDSLEGGLGRLQQQGIAYNIDAMLGLGESAYDRKSMASLLARLKPPQATVYMLEVNEGSYFYRQKYQPGKQLPHNEEVIEAYRQFCDTMEGLGYDHYEVSSFYRKGRPYPKHNMVYWEGNQPFAAYGMGATSLINGIRQTRPKTLSSYYRYVQGKEGMLESHDQTSLSVALEVKLMSRLRTAKGVCYDQLSEQFGYATSDRLRKAALEIAELNPSLFIRERLGSEKIQLTPVDGFLVCDQIIHRLIDSAWEAKM